VVELTGTRHSRAFEKRPGRRVVRDSIAWREVWEQTYSRREVAPRPEVDFAHEMVLAATSGMFQVDGRFAIDSVLQSDHRILAVVTLEIGCGPTGAVRYSGPTVLIRVPARREVKFIERERYMPGCP
jgi:hypothetical protein